MAKLNVGSICVTDLLEQAKAKHSAFVKSEKNGKIYANIKVWVNDTPDQYGNHISLQLNSSKERKDIEEKVYIGNAKQVEMKEPQPIGDNDVKGIVEEIDSLPF